LRGGAFYDLDHDVRAAARGGLAPSYRLYYIGFRVVFSPFTTDH
jgi:formylglycine-generating enzyme required for sulfatase activity